VADSLDEYDLTGGVKRLEARGTFESQNFDLFVGNGEGEVEVLLGVDAAVVEELMLATSSGVPHSSFISSAVSPSRLAITEGGSISWRSLEHGLHT